MNHKTYRCSFCLTPQDEAEALVIGIGGVCICNLCIDKAQEVATEAKQKTAADWDGSIWYPLSLNHNHHDTQ